MRLMRCSSMVVANSIVLAAALGCQDDLSTCQITQSDCQETIYSHMLSLRGDGYNPYSAMPPVSVISEDQFRQTLVNQPRTVNPWDKAFTLLHFDSGSSSAYIDDEVANVLAFYSWDSKTVTIVSHPSQTGKDAEDDAMITLAHEFVHSLQDQELDLRNSSFQSSDEYFAYDALIEGDARFYEFLFLSDLLHRGYTQSNIAGVIGQYLDRTYAILDQYGSSMFAAQALVYALGSQYEAVEYQSGGNAAIRHGYAHEPKQMIGFMGAPSGTRSGLTATQVCPAPEAAMPSDSLDGADEFGALLFYTFMRGWGVTHDTALAAAQSWTGDSVRLQATRDGATTAVAWRIELSAPAAAEITQALTATGELTVDSAANRLVITVSDSPTPLTWTAAPNCP